MAERMIKQIQIPSSNSEETGFSGTIYQLGIHALPGTQFLINGNSTITIGPTGNFSLNCEELPLSSIALKSRPLNTITYPTIIDIVYKEEVVNE